MLRRLSTILNAVHHTAAIAGLTIAFLTASGNVAVAQSSESASANGPAGTWAVEVTVRNCATGAPLGPAFHSLVTFHRGGTISESAGGSNFAPGQRSAGHGAWTQGQGRTYIQKMVALILFDTPANPPISPGFFAGWQTVTHTVELADADHLMSAGTNAFYRLDGTLYRTGCSTSTGRRFM